MTHCGYDGGSLILEVILVAIWAFALGSILKENYQRDKLRKEQASRTKLDRERLSWEIDEITHLCLPQSPAAYSLQERAKIQMALQVELLELFESHRLE